VTVRPIGADDAAALLRFHRGLSAETQRRRFLVYHPDLSDREVAWFTRVDHVRREALVALDGTEIAGVARYDRLDGDRAEVAVVVADAWQGRGVGTALLTRLVERARRRGITELVADTLSENVAIVRLLRRVGVLYDRTDDGGVARLRLRLAGAGAAETPDVGPWRTGTFASAARDPAGLD
jgi:RimJ/RimL family protein N-acetyltransferase